MFKRTTTSPLGFEHFSANPALLDMMMHPSLDMLRHCMRKQRDIGERYGGFIVPVSYVRPSGPLGTIDTMVLQQISTGISYILAGCGCHPGAELAKQNVICATAHTMILEYSRQTPKSEEEQLALAVFFSAVESVASDSQELLYTLNLVVYDAHPEPNPLQVLDDDDRQIAAFSAFPL